MSSLFRLLRQPILRSSATPAASRRALSTRTILARVVRRAADEPVYALIAANVGVWGLWQASANSREARQWMVEHFTTSTAGIVRELRFHTLITSAFSHASTTHLAVNMVSLYFFGRDAVAALGPQRFLTLYLGAGVLSMAAQAAWPMLGERGGMFTPVLGASGAVSAIVAWSILMYPRRIILLYFILPVPAALVGVLFIAKDSFELLGSSGSGTANAAHLGGAAVGALYFLLTRRP